jgi:hypothetical protein
MKIESIEHTHPNVFKARRASEKVLLRLRREMPSVPGVSVVANGSLARGEVTSQSDFDAYPLYTTGAKDRASDLFELVLQSAGLREFAAEGAFGVATPAITMRRKIGGQGDDNRRFTRRMLLILESTPIGDSAVYQQTLEAIVSRYISDDITDKQIGRFLLNDIIRFYRQMCVDFEFKTVEQTKPWGIRYTKLIFSRKLIYYSGVIMCAELASLPAAEKRQKLIQMIILPPIDRLLMVFGRDVLAALEEYDRFLALLDDRGSRDDLAKVELLRETHTPLFKTVKASGHKYSSALVDILRDKYPVDHPVREAIIV